MGLIGDMLKASSQIATINDVQSFAASATRFPKGLIVHPVNRNHPPRPPMLLEVYEFEACPFCRKVREVLTELDLAYISRTSARQATTKRDNLYERGGKRQFPYLIDANTDTELYESEDIIDYLFDTYGPGRKRMSSALSPLNTTLALFASAIRPRARAVRQGLEERDQPTELLVLYNMENSPYCRKVRESLNILNLDYQVENVGKSSARRNDLIERGGKMMVPYLIDPNTEVEMYESDDIVEYLEQTYGEA